MSLTGSQHKQIQDALLAAFDEAGLRLLCTVELDEDLDSIVGPGPLRTRVFDLAKWAQRTGRIPDLIAGSLCQNPKSPALISLAGAAKTWHIESPAPAEMSPYKGLEFFDVADAPLFFGREALTSELVDCLKDHRFLAVVGASGSGKSSLVRAGMVTVLKQGTQIKGSEKWAVHIVTPTVRPLTTLAASLTQGSESVTATTTLIEDMKRDARSVDLFAARLVTTTGASRLLLVVDQFEELFTLCKDHAEQQAYADNLLAAAVPAGVTTVILTLRADFYDRCAEFANLRLAISKNQNYIGPMSQDELRAAIEQPASQGGWDFETELVDAILADVEGEAGALPLLSHALLETWKRRRGRSLTFVGYHEAGGVHGAIAKTADSVYTELPPDQQAIARNIFLRLTTLGEGTQDTRRRAPLPELLGSRVQAAQVQTVIKRLEDERLITAERASPTSAGAEDNTDAVFVDVTHEALIREWPRLSAWLSEDREDLLVHRRLTKAAQEWEAMSRDAGTLFRGVLLAQTSEWAKTHDGDMNDQERAFLDASRKQANRSRNMLRGLGAAIIMLLVVALFAASWGLRVNQALLDATQDRLEGLLGEAAMAEEAQRQATLARIAQATAVASADLANAKLQDMEGERLVKEAREFKAALDVTAAISTFRAANAFDPTLIVISDEISDTLRYVATKYVQAGERILCESQSAKPGNCMLPNTGQIAASIVISPAYVAWARDIGPQLVGWSLDAPSLQLRAAISATALFSQALALNPPADTPVYVWIAPGSFEMGSTDEQCQEADIGTCPEDEQPQHTVELDGYWMLRTEVTNEQYIRCYEAGGCPDRPDNRNWGLARSARLPVTDVSWEQASAYAAWVGGRLPTEAEWEHACRNGDGRIWPWGNEPPATERLNYNSEVGGTSEVGTYPPGASTLYDMAGNVWEWIADWYDKQYYENSPAHNPPGPEKPEVDSYHILRGGALNRDDATVRCANRDLADSPVDGNYNVGFRVVSPGN